ncbi:MAG: WD40 repeat domain-containing protein, partial [Candidatus Poseidoniales archaeon]
MVTRGGKPNPASVRAILLSFLMITGTLFVSSAMAADTDGDGTDDSMDDCPVAAGNSTLDRTGCPDRDGDGTSDLNDPWVMSTGGYLQDSYQSSNDDYIMVRFNHDASQYATAENNGGSSEIRVWDTATRTNLRTIQVGDSAADIDWSPDGQYVAVHTNDEEVRIYVASDGSLYDTMDTNGEDAGELEYSPDGTMLAVTGNRDGNSGDGQIEIFDVDTNSPTFGDVLQTLNPSSTVYYYSVDWSPDGSRLVVGGYEAIYIIDTDTWGENRTITNAFSTLNSVHYSPDGNMISACSAWGGSNARAKVYNAMTGAEMWSYTTSTSCNDAAWSPDSSQVAFTHTYYQSDGASINIFFSTSGTKIDTLSAPRPGGCTSGG